MTKEQTNEAIKVMEAYVDGKQIQSKTCDKLEWSDCIEPIWDFDTFIYRVKPEPKLRPYTFAEMCEAVKKHGVMVKSKKIAEVCTITGFVEEYIFCNVEVCETYEEFMKSSVWFDDNSPCGILEE